MIVHSLWITRKSADSDYPELLLAWDEFSIDENRAGWEEECQKELAAVGTDLAQARMVELEVDDDDVKAAFAARQAPVEVRASREVHPHGAG